MVDVATCGRLITQVMPRGGQHPVANQLIVGIISSHRQGAEALGQLQRQPVFADRQAIPEQGAERPQLKLGVFNSICDIECRCPGRAHLQYGTLSA